MMDESLIPRASDRYAKSTEDMMEVLISDIDRFEVLADIVNTDNDLIKTLEQIESETNVVAEIENETQTVDNGPTPSSTRFVAVSLEETDNFVKESANKNTVYKTRSDMKIFREWGATIGELRDPAEISPEELDTLLARFVVGARKRDGSEYEPDSLSSIHNSIDRHLRDNKNPYSIKRDTIFSHSRRVLEAKRKSLKCMGKGNKTNKADALSKDEIDVLHGKKLLGLGNPESLLNTVWINNGIYFGLRGRQDHANLLWGDITLKSTTSGKEFLEFNERSTKTRSGAKAGDYRKVSPKMFAQPENPNCPVLVYKKYRDHRPEDLAHPDSRFYLMPLEAVKCDKKVWYSHQPVGKDKLGKMMSIMAEKGELKGRKVNHSTRKTFASSLVQAGVPPTEIAHLGGWKNIQSINEYSVPSITQQEQASKIISNTVLPSSNSDDHVQVSHFEKNTESCTLMSNTKKSCTATSQEIPFSMFGGATITGGSITINICPPEKKMRFSQHTESLSQK